jgi:hypothetical protein
MTEEQTLKFERVLKSEAFDVLDKNGVCLGFVRNGKFETDNLKITSSELRQIADYMDSLNSKPVAA